MVVYCIAHEAIKSVANLTSDLNIERQEQPYSDHERAAQDLPTCRKND